MVAGDLGADVIKVEAPSGDPVRALAPPRFGDDATYFLAVNRHRRNVTADLRIPDDVAFVRSLLSVADAVVENFLPSQRQSLGLDAWREAFPDVAWVSISAASSGGPLSDEPAFDLLAQARSGIMSVTGESNGEPLKVGAPIADVVTGLYGAVGLLAALYARATGGASRHVEAPLLESAMSALVNQAQGYFATGVVPQRLGNHHPSITPYGPVTTNDGHLLLAVGTNAQFAALVHEVDDPELSTATRWRTNDERVAERATLQAVLDRVFSAASTEEWVQRLRGTGVPHAPIYNVADAFAQDHVRDGSFVTETDAPAGRIGMMRSPLILDGVRPDIRRGPRRLGEDNSDFARP